MQQEHHSKLRGDRLESDGWPHSDSTLLLYTVPIG
jgi:hypothetical protein